MLIFTLRLLLLGNYCIERKTNINSTFRHRFGANCVSIVYSRLMFKRQNPVFPFYFSPPCGWWWGEGWEEILDFAA